MLRFLFIFTICSSLNITWVSEPVLPGQYALVQVSNSKPTDSWFIRAASHSEWSKLNTFSGRTYAGVSVFIPKTIPKGEFFLKINDGPEFSVNGPKPWWLFGDGGDFSTPNGYIRVFGVNIHSPTGIRPMLKLVQIEAKAIVLKASSWKANENHAQFELPAESELPFGVYEVFISNDGGMSWVQPCTFLSIMEDLISSCYSSWRILQPKKWKDKLFNVLDYGLDLPIPGRDATDAVFAAVEAANSNGGGIVYFPRGQYFLYTLQNKTSIKLASGVRLQGAGKTFTAIYFKEQQRDQAPTALITSTTDKATWGIEGLTIYVTAYFNFIIYLTTGTDGFFMRDVRIRANSWFCLSENVKPDNIRGRSANWKQNHGTCVGLAGRNIFIENNDVYCSGSTIGTLDEPGILQDFMRISNNLFQHGATGHWGIYWKYAINEDNTYSGIGITADGSNYCQYGGPNPNVYNIFHDNNTMHNVWGDDREMMTLDWGGGSYYGPIDPRRTTNNLIKLKAEAVSTPYFNNLCVIAGTGTGQCQRITQNINNRTFTIVKPFAQALDETSMVTILPYLGQFIFTNNHYYDGGAIQTYTQAFDMVFSNNTFERMGGLFAWGRFGTIFTQAYNINLHVQFLRNHFLEGNHVWNYNTVSPAPYHEGGVKQIEPWSMGVLSPIIKIARMNETYPFSEIQGAMNRFIVLRENRIDNNGGIRIAGNSSNVLVESNIISNSDVGIHVNSTCTALGGIVLVNNTEPPNVPPNFNPYLQRHSHFKRR